MLLHVLAAEVTRVTAVREAVQGVQGGPGGEWNEGGEGGMAVEECFERLRGFIATFFGCEVIPHTTSTLLMHHRPNVAVVVITYKIIASVTPCAMCSLVASIF